MGVCVPEAYGGAGADYLSYVLVLEELSRADAGVGVTLAVHLGAGMLPILDWATEEQKQRLVPPLAAGERAVRVRADRGRRPAPTPRALRTQADATAASPAPSSGSPTARYASTFTVFAARRGRHRRPSSCARRARLQRHPRGGEDGPATPPRPPTSPSTTRPASGSARPARGCGSRCARSTAGASGSPPRRSGIAQAALELATGLRQGAPRVRRPDRPLPGDPAQARRHADRDRGRARAGLARGAPEGRRPPAHDRGRAGQAVRLAASRAARPARRSRSSAATATRRSSRPSATTATPRSPRSTRARARSSGSSSPAALLGEVARG